MSLELRKYAKRDNLTRRLKKVLGDTVLRKVPEEEAALYGGGAFDYRKNEIIMAKDDPSILAHEIGHAHFQKSMLGKLTQNIPARAAHALGPLAGFAPIAGDAIRSTSGKALAIAAPLLLAAPTLVSEGVATYKGHSLLTEAGASPEELSDYRKKMLHGFGTYAQSPIAGTALAASGVLLRGL